MALLRDVRDADPQIEAWWREQPVAGMESGVKRMRHPDRGALRYEHVVLQFADHPDLVLVAFDAGTALEGGAQTPAGAGTAPSPRWSRSVRPS